jgi:hypothetical protein
MISSCRLSSSDSVMSSMVVQSKSFKKRKKRVFKPLEVDCVWSRTVDVSAVGNGMWPCSVGFDSLTRFRGLSEDGISPLLALGGALKLVFPSAFPFVQEMSPKRISSAVNFSSEFVLSNPNNFALGSAIHIEDFVTNVPTLTNILGCPFLRRNPVNKPIFCIIIRMSGAKPAPDDLDLKLGVGCLIGIT